MENKARDSLFYEKLRTIFLGAILLMLVSLLVGALIIVNSLKHYDRQITNIVDRLESVSEQLEELEVERLVLTANRISAAVDAAKIDEIVTSLNEVSRELNEIDWTELAGNINDLAVNAQTSLEGTQEALEKLKNLDIESLNTAIADLQAVIEPLANFTKRFG